MQKKILSAAKKPSKLSRPVSCFFRGDFSANWEIESEKPCGKKKQIAMEDPPSFLVNTIKIRWIFHGYESVYRSVLTPSSSGQKFPPPRESGSLTKIGPHLRSGS